MLPWPMTGRPSNTLASSRNRIFLSKVSPSMSPLPDPSWKFGDPFAHGEADAPIDVVPSCWNCWRPLDGATTCRHCGQDQGGARGFKTLAAAASTRTHGELILEVARLRRTIEHAVAQLRREAEEGGL